MASPFAPGGQEKFLPSRVHYSPESAMGQELSKWEIRDRNAHNLPPAEYGRPEGAGKYPYVYQEYPKMLYKADRTTGKPEIVGRRTVENEGQERIANGEGFVEGQDKAIALFLEHEQRDAVLAGNRAFHEKGMSEKAQAEAVAAEVASGVRHLPSVPETPVRAVDKRTKAYKDAQKAKETV